MTQGDKEVCFPMKLFTIGYGHWNVTDRMERLLSTLKNHGIYTVIDIRHSPCSPNLVEGNRYGPKSWTLQSTDKGIKAELLRAGIEYLWLVELGNPQKVDTAMALLKEQIASKDERWPIQRGLRLLDRFFRDSKGPCCLLCACEHYERCHRGVVAEALRDRYFGGSLEIEDLA